MQRTSLISPTLTTLALSLSLYPAPKHAHDLADALEMRASCPPLGGWGARLGMGETTKGCGGVGLA